MPDFLEDNEIVFFENLLDDKNFDKGIKERIRKNIIIYNTCIERCETPDANAIGFLRYYLKNKRLPIIKIEIEI